MSVKPRTVGLISAGALLVAGLLYVSFRTDPVPVDLHIVTSGPMQVTIDADGQTRIRDLYEISSPISGSAKRSPVKVGDRVVQGETVVAIVEPAAPALLDARTRLQAQASLREAQAALHVAETGLIRAQEEYNLAQTNFDRMQTLVDRKVASLTQLENAAQSRALTLAGVEAAEAQIDMAKSTLQRAEVTLMMPDQQKDEDAQCCISLLAPANGVVLSISSISERPVAAGALLVTVGDPQDLELEVDLLSTDAVRLNDGTVARVERWGGPQPLSATLDRIEPVATTKVSALGIEEQRVDAIFTLTSPIEDRPNLSDGFAVYARIIEWEAAQALTVPLSALFKRGDSWAVYTVTGDLVLETAVEIGQRNNRSVEVLGGLSEGDRVITHPSDEVSLGARIVERGQL